MNKDILISSGVSGTVWLFIGIIIGWILSKKATQRQLYSAYLNGLRKGRKEQLALLQQMGRTIARLEASNRRINLVSIDGGAKDG